MSANRIAIIGLGKIAHDQHVPAIAASPDFELVATVSPHGDGLHDIPHFADIEELAESGIEVDAVAVCTPPQVRAEIAAVAMERRWHTFLEKPPAAGVAEVAELQDAATQKGCSLFTAWHAQFAAGVKPARRWLADKTINRVNIVWREDVREWHPGEQWIWRPGGFGVFDPGINALSIATTLLPLPFSVTAAELYVPENRAAPIAAQVAFRDAGGQPVEIDLDFRQRGQQTWDITFATDSGTLVLSQGGSHLRIRNIDRVRDESGLDGEYHGLYQRFASIIAGGISDVDVAPLQLVDDIFRKARFNSVEPFIE